MAWKDFCDPAKASKGGGGFKEGFVRVLDDVRFEVYQAQAHEGAAARQPVLALVWPVVRLDETAASPLEDENGNEIREELVFGLGKKSLEKAHPGMAKSPDAGEDEVEDVCADGVEVGQKGNTVYLLDPNWTPNEKCAFMYLMKSLVALQWTPRTPWAQDFVGSVVYMVNENSGEKMTGDDGKERDLMYKVVKKIPVFGYKKTGKTKATGTTTGKTTAGTAGKASGAAAKTETAKAAAGDGKTEEAEALLCEIMQEIAQEKAGVEMTAQALRMNISQRVTKKKRLDLMAPVVKKATDGEWMAEMGGGFGINYSEDGKTVTIAAE